MSRSNGSVASLFRRASSHLPLAGQLLLFFQSQLKYLLLWEASLPGIATITPPCDWTQLPVLRVLDDLAFSRFSPRGLPSLKARIVAALLPVVPIVLAQHLIHSRCSKKYFLNGWVIKPLHLLLRKGKFKKVCSLSHATQEAVVQAEVETKHQVF